MRFRCFSLGRGQARPGDLHHLLYALRWDVADQRRCVVEYKEAWAGVSMAYEMHGRRASEAWADVVAGKSSALHRITGKGGPPQHMWRGVGNSRGGRRFAGGAREFPLPG